MINWKTYKLSEAAEIIKNGYKPSANDELNYIGLEHIEQQSLRLAGIGKSSDVTSGKYKFKAGDILFGKLRPYFRKVYSPKFEGVCSTDIWVVRAKRKFDQGFLLYFLASQEFVDLTMQGSSGTRMPRADWNTLKGIEFSFPDLSTQHCIAEILSALDDKIELNRRMNQTLEQMAQTLHEKYSDVDEFVPLNDLVELNPRLTLRKGTVSQYVEMSNLSENSASIKKSILREYSGGAKFQNNDSLLARITPCLENGKTGFVDILEDNEVGFGSTEYIVMRAKQGISPYFVYCIARDKAFREHAMRSMTGTSGRQRVQIDMLENFALPNWSAESMNGFHASAYAAFQKIKSNSAEINTLTQLRDTLLPKLMSGKIDVMQSKLTEQHEPILS